MTLQFFWFFILCEIFNWETQEVNEYCAECFDYAIYIHIIEINKQNKMLLYDSEGKQKKKKKD